MIHMTTVTATPCCALLKHAADNLCMPQAEKHAASYRADACLQLQMVAVGSEQAIVCLVTDELCEQTQPHQEAGLTVCQTEPAWYGKHVSDTLAHGVGPRAADARMMPDTISGSVVT